MNKISVIVPVYKVEEYLDKCVESIVNQTYKNIEVILVDDGSPDNCPAMCDEWAEKDRRIKVIHKENGGLSDARNAGIKQACGEWIFFVDSDDYISENALQCLLDSAIDNNCDIAVGRFDEFGAGASHITDADDSIRIFSQIEYWQFYYDEFFLGSYKLAANLIISCAKLIKSSVFDDLKFDVSMLHEDEFIIHKLIARCQKIAVVNSCLYYYLQREGSIMSKAKIKNIKCAFDAFFQREEFFISNIEYSSIINSSIEFLLNRIISLYFDIKYFYKDLEYCLKLKAEFKKYYRLLKKNCSSDYEYYDNNKMLFWSFYHNEYLYRIVRKLISR